MRACALRGNETVLGARIRQKISLNTKKAKAPDGAFAFNSSYHIFIMQYQLFLKGYRRKLLVNKVVAVSGLQSESRTDIRENKHQSERTLGRTNIKRSGH
jgi:hypothetical protein